MYKLDINGKEYESEKDMALLDFLRPRAQTKSPKRPTL